MKHKIKFRCGHEEEHQLFGPMREREKKLAWFAEKDCQECHVEKLYAARKGLAQACAEISKAEGLPVLTGSEAQIIWAESIRASAMVDLRILRDIMAKNADEHDSARIGLDIVDRTISRTRAKDWIDDRNITYTRVWLAKKVGTVLLKAEGAYDDE